MTKRSAPQHDVDDRCFPIRVKVRVPPFGFGGEFDRMEAWLLGNVGRGDYAHHAARTLGGHAVGFYFRRIEDAAAFLAAFPLLELADDTTGPGYRSPVFPFGRPQP